MCHLGRNNWVRLVQKARRLHLGGRGVNYLRVDSPVQGFLRRDKILTWHLQESVLAYMQWCFVPPPPLRFLQDEGRGVSLGNVHGVWYAVNDTKLTECLSSVPTAEEPKPEFKMRSESNPSLDPFEGRGVWRESRERGHQPRSNDKCLTMSRCG